MGFPTSQGLLQHSTLPARKLPKHTEKSPTKSHYGLRFRVGPFVRCMTQTAHLSRATVHRLNMSIDNKLNLMAKQTQRSAKATLVSNHHMHEACQARTRTSSNPTNGTDRRMYMSIHKTSWLLSNVLRELA